MREGRQLDPSLLLRVGGISALVAGALFFLTVVYAFGFMSGFGFTQEMFDDRALLLPWVDRKSTRLNSSHANISYAVFCLKKKKKYRFRSTGTQVTCTFNI